MFSRRAVMHFVVPEGGKGWAIVVCYIVTVSVK
jgi:hypothetical protein